MYKRQVLEAGGIPVSIPMVGKSEAEELVSKVDGVVFPGGADIDPQRYMERPHQKLGAINPRLDELELNVARLALERRLPILEMCIRDSEIAYENKGSYGILAGDIVECLPQSRAAIERGQRQ